MKEQKVSRTALRTAYIRAAHQLLDDRPRILDDPLAVSMIGPAGVKRILDTADLYHDSFRRALRAHVLLRSRFAEDRLEIAVSHGIRQYIILGAGFDTFALRQPEWARELRIIEVDQPGTQAYKRSLISMAGLEIPSNLQFADIDVERESLRKGLGRYNVSMEEQAFFSCLGVIMYLKEKTVETVIEPVASFPAGSEIVLTFQSPPGDKPSPYDRRTTDLDEPWLSYFEPAAMEAKLRGAGFSKVAFLTPFEAEVRYFRGRTDNLSAPRRTNILSAVR